ncbi:hypothetical protein GCM10018952_34850 [Streptosporangium vulgare]
MNGSTKFSTSRSATCGGRAADIEHNKILEPEVCPQGDRGGTIVLNIKAGIGDVEVRRCGA